MSMPISNMLFDTSVFHPNADWCLWTEENEKKSYIKIDLAITPDLELTLTVSLPARRRITEKVEVTHTTIGQVVEEDATCQAPNSTDAVLTIGGLRNDYDS